MTTKRDYAYLANARSVKERYNRVVLGAISGVCLLWLGVEVLKAVCG